MKTKIVLIIATAITLSIATSEAQEAPVREVSLIPQWSPQAQFAGYYVAYEKGIYKKYGLAVNIIKGGPDFPPEQMLKERKADFAVMWLSSAIKERAHESNIVNIAQIIQHSALMLVAKKSSGISSLKDINGKRVSIWEGDLQIQPKALFRKYGLDVTIIPQSYSVNLFLSGGVDVVSAMWYNEYHSILNSGINEDELTTFFYDQYDLNFPEDGIYVREETFNKDPEAAKAFVKASLEGWLYAFSHPDEAIDIVIKCMKEANVPANKTQQRWMLEKMADIILADMPNNIGILKQEDYHKVAEELKQAGLIVNIPNFDDFYKETNEPIQK